MTSYEQARPIVPTDAASAVDREGRVARGSERAPQIEPGKTGLTWTISAGELIGLCQRVGTSIKAGVDIRRIWQSEASRGKESHRRHMEQIFRRVSAGDTVADAMRGCHGYIPPLTCQMVEIGEKTGQLDEVLLKLAHYYEQQAAMRRMFYFGIAWPMIQLFGATFVIALVIWINGFVNTLVDGVKLDILGLGLSGASGALIFIASVATVIAGIVLAINGLLRGWFGPAPIQMAMRLPIIGNCLEAFALARLTWSFALGLESGMDARRVVELAIAATQNKHYEQHSAAVTAAIGRGQTFHEAFAQTKAFPDDFLFALETAEIAGTTNESLLRLTKQYEEKAQGAMRMLTMAATAVTFLVVTLVIVLAIARMAMFYIGQLYSVINEPI
ncbi:Type II secretion system protein F [Anatilimnocola aggregata]|uniref:Type II secretion system protein F n=1 Tax=Anatilimnocola aggregata TaxID=2528021 RepID=A0A517Y5F9_9BACT|nr:type II secretion system F family protein [Anatilimnocola aggregata]QDU25430.1 Type II secretion system protein F [Anatilimnocola aggregata]